MDFSVDFTRDPSFAFLNGGTLSRTPLRALGAVEEHRRAGERNPTHAVYSCYREFWEIQEKLAPVFGVDPSDLYLRSNITSAVNDFLFALPLPRGAEVLVTGLEYGAVANAAKLKSERVQGSFRVAPLPLRTEVTVQELEEAVTGAIGAKTKLLVVSHVATPTGTILPVAAIAREARKRGVTVLVDGAHAPGALDLDISSLGVDFYGGNLHKWFMGPMGTAFGWVRPGLSGLEWQFGGWATYGKGGAFQDFQGSEEALRRLFPGTMDTAPFVALHEVLAYWREKGTERIRARQRSLRDLAAAIAEEAGWERVSPRDPSLLGPLVSFRRPRHWPDLAAAELAIRIYRECAVQVALPEAQGERLVRLSPGAYGTEEEVRGGMKRLVEWGG